MQNIRKCHFMYKIILLLPLMIFTLACNRPVESTATITQQAPDWWTPPAAGQVVDQLEQRVTEDKLNKKFFRVTLLSTEESQAGIYVIQLAFGHNNAEREITLPRWTGDLILKPVLKEGSEKYHCLMGFEANDGQFHELYEIKIVDGDIVFRETHKYFL